MRPMRLLLWSQSRGVGDWGEPSARRLNAHAHQAHGHGTLHARRESVHHATDLTTQGGLVRPLGRNKLGHLEAVSRRQDAGGHPEHQGARAGAGWLAARSSAPREHQGTKDQSSDTPTRCRSGSRRMNTRQCTAASSAAAGERADSAELERRRAFVSCTDKPVALGLWHHVSVHLVYVWMAEPMRRAMGVACGEDPWGTPPPALLLHPTPRSMPGAFAFGPHSRRRTSLLPAREKAAAQRALSHIQSLTA